MSTDWKIRCSNGINYIRTIRAYLGKKSNGNNPTFLNNTVGTASIKNAFIEKNTSIDDGLVQYNDPIEISFTGAERQMLDLYIMK